MFCVLVPADYPDNFASLFVFDQQCSSKVSFRDFFFPPCICISVESRSPNTWRGGKENTVALQKWGEYRVVIMGEDGAKTTCELRGSAAASAQSRWCQWCFKWPRYHSCIKHTGLQSALSPRASLCAIRLPLNSSKLAVGFFTLCLWRARG